MKVLSIDTSGQQASAAIVSEYITIGEILLNARTGEKAWTHSEILMPGINQLFKLTRLSPQDINYIAYTCGPGSFTGLRIGASTALGMAKALNIQAVPVPTLDALAYNALKMGRGNLVVSMLDARRGQVYTATYTRCATNGGISKTSDYMAMPVEDLTEFLTKESDDILFLGDGADANSEQLRKVFPHSLIAPANNNSLRASSAGLWAVEKIQNGYEFSDKVDILYVRAPQAVREAKKT